jgi:hypothetical protein
VRRARRAIDGFLIGFYRAEDEEGERSALPEVSEMNVSNRPYPAVPFLRRFQKHFERLLPGAVAERVVRLHGLVKFEFMRDQLSWS